MDIFVKITAFNPELAGKAIRLEGFDSQGTDISGVYLVRSVRGQQLNVTNIRGGYDEVLQDSVVKIEVLG